MPHNGDPRRDLEHPWYPPQKKPIPTWNGQLSRGVKNAIMDMNNIPTWDEQPQRDLQKERNIHVRMNRLNEETERKKRKSKKLQKLENLCDY